MKYSRAKQIISLMSASRLGAFMEGLNYEELTTEEKNHLSSKWGQKLKRWSNNTFEDICEKLPVIMISDEIHERLETLTHVTHVTGTEASYNDFFEAIYAIWPNKFEIKEI